MLTHTEAKNLYALALAQVEALRAEKKALMQPVPPICAGSPESEIEAYFEQECLIEKGLGYWEAIDMLTAAENALIQSAQRVVAKHPFYRVHQKEIEAVVNCELPSIRAKLIDLCARLAD